MKKHILTVAATALLAIPTITFAADGDKPEGERPKRPEGAGGPGGRGGFSPEERMKRMTELLGLTEDQQAKIKAIMDKSAEANKALMAKGRENLTDEDKAALRESFGKQRDEINAVLTPEQQEKMKAAGQRRGGPGGPGGDRPRPGGDGEGRPDKKAE